MTVVAELIQGEPCGDGLGLSWLQRNSGKTLQLDRTYL